MFIGKIHSWWTLVHLYRLPKSGSCFTVREGLYPLSNYLLYVSLLMPVYFSFLLDIFSLSASTYSICVCVSQSFIPLVGWMSHLCWVFSFIQLLICHDTLENIASQAVRLKTLSLFYNRTHFCWIFWALSSSWESSWSLFPNCWHLPALSFIPSSLSVIHNSDSTVTYYHLSFIPAHFRNDIFYVDIWISLPFTFLSTLIQLCRFFTWSSNSAVQLPLPSHTASSITKGMHSSAYPWACQRTASIRCWFCSGLRSRFCLWAGGRAWPHGAVHRSIQQC